MQRRISGRVATRTSKFLVDLPGMWPDKAICLALEGRMCIPVVMQRVKIHAKYL
jgi:hypothetical protein